MKTLHEILRSELEPYDFPGTDAAVLVINKKVPQVELEKLCEPLRCQIRFYPTETGWKIKAPYSQIADFIEGQEHTFSPLQFTKEPRGWDHEHCSFCHEHITIGTACFTAPHEKGDCYLICEVCSRKCG
jgi:hypothetical protein